jgi:hypothetical protein
MNRRSTHEHNATELHATEIEATRWQRVRSWLGLERNIVVMLGALLVLGMGEELWLRYVPKYLEVLGAGAWGIAAYGTLSTSIPAAGSLIASAGATR